jgi:hypothetical protein
MFGGPFVCIKVRWAELGELMLPGRGPSTPAFSNSSNSFSNRKSSHYLYARPSDHRSWTVRECAKGGNFPITTSIEWISKYKWWSCMRALLAIPSIHWEHLRFPNTPTHPHCLRLHSSEWLSESSALHHRSDLEALGGTSSGRHWLVTLGGCRLLDCLVVNPSNYSWRLWKGRIWDCEGFAPTTPERQRRH